MSSVTDARLAWSDRCAPSWAGRCDVRNRSGLPTRHSSVEHSLALAPHGDGQLRTRLGAGGGYAIEAHCSRVVRGGPADDSRDLRMDGYFTTERHQRLRQEVRAFAETAVRPRIPDMEASKEVQHDLSRLIARQGWLGVTISRDYGGMGLGHLAKTIIIEELSRVSGAMGAMVQASQLGVAKILHFGNEVQKKTWLPVVADGSCLPTIAVTESQSGGHVLGIAATAVRDGDDYVLNGRKVFVGNSHVGDLHGFSFGELIFDNCRVPAANLLGAEGDGLAVAYSSSILYGRPNLTAVSLGIHQALIEETSAFVTEQHRYGRPLHDLLPIKLKVGQMQSRLMTARLVAYHAVHLLDQGLPCDAELMNAKLINVEYALDSARNAMEVHAACGLFPDRPVERYLRDAHHIFAPAGTSDVQRLRLGEVALGMSKGQWSHRLAATTRAAADASSPT